MHAYKKALLSVALSFLLPFSAMSADDDGTFTITIQGPEIEDAQPQVQSVQTVRRAPARRAAPRQNRLPSVNATATMAPSASVNQSTGANSSNAAQVQQTPARTYAVASGDTIWSVAHRYMPQDRSVNEFQIVASIYRNNPRAFGQGNVNNLLRTTITIPPLAQIARETTDTGSRLLSQGSMTLPPLGNVTENSSSSRAGTTAAVSTQAPSVTATPAPKPMQSLSDGDIPQYTATETKIKKLQEEEAKKDLSVALPDNTKGADLDKSQVSEKTAENNSSKDSSNDKAPANAKAMSADLAAAAVDSQSIRIMLEGNKKAIDEKTKVLEQQLAEAMERMKKTSAATAKTAADSVSTLASQYDNIISGLQQDIIEIKGNISKLSQDNDRMREMLLANDEKIEDMQLQLSQFSVSAPTSVVDLDKPVMMILFGAGLLALVMMIVFLIIKLKSRASAKMTDDFDDVDDFSADDTLLSDENGSIDLEAPVLADDEPESPDVPQKAPDKNSNSINSPSDSVSDVETALNEKEQVSVQNEAASENTANDSISDNSPAQENKAEKDEAQEAWDNAASTNSADETKDDKTVLDEWSKALNEQTENDKSVDLGANASKDSSQDDMASAWESALNEQESAQSKNTEKSDDDALADAWGAALNEQKSAEENTNDSAKAPKSEEEKMADAWSAALNEQKSAEENTNDSTKAPKSEEEKMADAWSAALNEQKSAEEKTDDSAKAPKSEEEAMADAWSAALDEQNSTDEKNSEHSETDESLKENTAHDKAPVDSEVSDVHSKSEEDVIAESMAKHYENSDNPISDDNASDNNAQRSEDGDADTQVAVDEAADTSKNSQSTAESEPVITDTEADIHQSADVNTDDVKVEDVSEDELLNHISENTDRVLEENLPDAGEIGTDAGALQSDEHASSQNNVSADTEISQEDDADPQAQLSGEEKAFLESMSDSSEQEKEQVDNSEPATESDNKDDNIPDAEADVVTEDEVPPGHKSAGSNIDEVLNDDLNLEDILNGNVVDAPEEAQTEDEKSDGVEVFDATTDDVENHVISDGNEADIIEPAETTEDKEDNLIAGSDTSTADENTVEHSESADSVSDGDSHHGENVSGDHDPKLYEESAENIDDIQNRSEQAIFNDDVKDDNSTDENGVVSWAVPDDDFDIVGKGKETETVSADTPSESSENEETVSSDSENTKSDETDSAQTSDVDAKAENDSDDARALDDLEKRLTASKAQYDTGADEDIMNMLSGGVHDDMHHDNEKAFTEDEIASMMSSAQSADPENIPEDSLDMDDSVEEKGSETQTEEDHSLENVADTIGPISSERDDEENSANFDGEENSDDFEGLNAKQHQYYVDELNLARLYFETGDTEEALKIIDDVKEHGSSDLKDEAAKIIETYGN